MSRPLGRLFAWLARNPRAMSHAGHPSVTYAMAREGRIYLCAPSGTDLTHGRVVIGGTAFPIERHPADQEFVPASTPRRYIYRLVPEDIKSRKSSGYAVGTNVGSEWVLHGYPTHFVRIRKPTIEHRLVLVDGKRRKVRLPPGHYVFSGYFAAHRARAVLAIMVLGPKGTILRRDEVPFDDNHLGGRMADGYCNVRFNFEVAAENCQLGVEIIYLAPSDPHVVETDPYLFFAECYVAREGDAAAERLEGAHPIVSGHPQSLANGQLFVSLVDPLAFRRGGHGILLDHGGTMRPILKVDLSPVIVSEENGLFCISAAKTRLVTVYVDGELSQTRVIGTHAHSVLVNPRFHDGRTHKLMIRDESGTACLHEEKRSWPVSLTPLEVLEAEANDHANSMSFASDGATRYQCVREKIAEKARDCGVYPDELARILSALEAGPDRNTTFAPIRFRHCADPDVSIIIPAHNHFSTTYHCLCAILISANRASFEIILVDDGSTDATTRISDIVSGIACVRHDQPKYFLAAVNSGATRAKGRYIALLNNDTEPLDGWLDEMLRVFDTDPDAGLVGSKLLYPDGRLQEAGGIVFASGDPANYGRGDNPYDPKYCYVRRADYVSGASMMTPRAVWEEIGGFSTYLEKMYFEDTDYAFKIRESGRTVWFTPFSQVIHFEGKTSGTSTSSGMKRYQEINHPKFKQRWQEAFKGLVGAGVGMDIAKDGKVSGHVVFIDAATPQPDRDAGSYAAVVEMELVKSLGYKVTFVPQNMAWLGSYTEDLQRRGIEVAYQPFFRSVADVIGRLAPHTDAFYITRYDVGRRHIEKIRRIAPRAKILFNLADLHFLRELRAALAGDDPVLLQQSRRTRDAELAVVRNADVTLSYSEVEHAIITSCLMENIAVVKCPWVVKTAEHVPGFGLRRGICFLGSFRHLPNEEGLRYFIHEAMPALLERLPDIVLHVYGSNMQDRHKEIASQSVVIEGYVENLSAAFDKHRVFVAPLISGAGIKGKVLAALAHGIPVVLSPLAAEGIGLQDGWDCLIAENSAGWAAAIARLYDDNELWMTLSANGQRLIERRYSFSVGKRLMQTAFDRAGVGRS